MSKSIPKKHAVAISSLFNTIAANEVMQRAIASQEAPVPQMPHAYWQGSSLDAVRTLRDVYGITVPGYTSLL